jgi:hypothetical protein
MKRAARLHPRRERRRRSWIGVVGASSRARLGSRLTLHEIVVFAIRRRPPSRRTCSKGAAPVSGVPAPAVGAAERSVKLFAWAGGLRDSGSAIRAPSFLRALRPSYAEVVTTRLDETRRLTPGQSKRFWEGVAFAERFFMGLDEVHKAMRKLCATLDADGIPYAIAGAMALNAHGYRRVTTDVDVLLTREGLAAFKAKHVGRGWVERFPGSKNLRDAELDVKIDVLLTGDYPGDGKPKPVSFPDPRVAIRGDGVLILSIKDLVELKLASGMTSADRLKDLADVQELIRHARLPLELGGALHPMVREKYLEIWHATTKDADD